MTTLYPQNKDFSTPLYLEPARRAATDLEREHPLQTATRDELYSQYLCGAYRLARTYTLPDPATAIYEKSRRYMPEDMGRRTISEASDKELRIAAIAYMCWAAERRDNQSSTTKFADWLTVARDALETYRTRTPAAA